MKFFETVIDTAKTAGLVWAGTAVGAVIRNTSQAQAPQIFDWRIPGTGLAGGPGVSVSNALHIGVPIVYAKVRGKKRAPEWLELLMLGISGEGFGQALEEVGIGNPFNSLPFPDDAVEPPTGDSRNGGGGFGQPFNVGQRVGASQARGY